MSAVKLTIDGREISVETGATIFDAARKLKIDIPTFCYDPDLAPNGACRICLVEVEKARTLVASCVAPAGPGMVVHTESPRVVRARRAVLSLMLANHPLDCITCEKTGSCKLQDYCYRYQVAESEFAGDMKNLPYDDSNEYFLRDMNKCILCGICVGKCNEVVGAGAIDFTGRGFTANVGPAYEDAIEASTCVFCGLCIESCPVGALIPRHIMGRGRSWQTEKTTVVCPHCSVGCNLELDVRKDSIVDARAAVKNPVNRDQLCKRGKFGWDFVHHGDRLERPLIKRNGVFVEVEWQEALQTAADNFEELKYRYDAEALMGLCSPKVSNEAAYLFQKLVRSSGSNHVDSFSRYGLIPDTEELIESLDGATSTNSLEELAHTGAVLVVEADLAESHPVIGYRIREAVSRGAKLIVAAPEPGGLADLADYHLALRPGSAVALLIGIAHIILAEGLHDSDYIEKRTRGFAEFKKAIDRYTPVLIAELTGLKEEEVICAARAFAEAKSAAVVSAFSREVGKFGEGFIGALVNLLLLTGNLGKESAGLYLPYPENNMQGCIDMGILPGRLSGYQLLTDRSVREKFERVWDVRLNAKPGTGMAGVLDGGSTGIRALYILGEDPLAASGMDPRVIRFLENLDFLVVQDIFPTETAALADIVLPATTFAEEESTYTNTERRVQLNIRALQSPGEAWPDWLILTHLANTMGYRWAYRSTEEVFAEMAVLNPSYRGIDYERLSARGIQWPCPDRDHPGTDFLYEGRFESGVGSFQSVDYKPRVETAIQSDTTGGA